MDEHVASGGSAPPNIVLVLVDSLNRGDLRCYAGPSAPVETPNVDRLARRARRFDNHFVGSLPCMPARRELFAGFKELLWRPWGPLEHFDLRLPRLLEAQGYATAIVTDHYHYWEESGNGYLQSFQQTELVRGHEHDNWRPPVPPDEPVPRWVENVERWRPGAGRQYYANVRDFASEEDFFPARVFGAAARWLDRPPRRPFFLQIESFDVHEPFHVPEPYRSAFGDPSGYDRFTVWPPYQDPRALAAFMAAASPEELAFVRSQYLAKLAFVDARLGAVFDALDRGDLWPDTVVILTTDHGHDLGERGVFGKQYPHWDSHANIPLLVWHPERPGEGRPVTALTQTVDLFATLADAAGVALDAPHGRSLVPLLGGEPVDGWRQALLYGTFGEGVCCTDGEWTLFKSPTGDAPLYAYSSLLVESLVHEGVAVPVGQGRFIPDVSFPQWRIPVRHEPRSRADFLFNRLEDAGQTRNLWLGEPARRRRTLGALRELIAHEGAPEEQLIRLGL
jgi:arylsulfatase A-like enzyme